jgi:hypothetical protein
MMVLPAFQRLVVVAVFGVLSVVPRVGSATLHFATGDHWHVLIGASDEHHRDHNPVGRANNSTQTGPSETGADTLAASDNHKHDCVDVGVSGDYKPAASGGLAAHHLALAPLPIMVGGATPDMAPGRLADSGRPTCPFGLTPPDLARSTVLLI